MPRRQSVYFLVEKSHERFKVGLAADPARRWATFQSHSQTDFRESLVFEVEPEVSVRWVEETIHNFLREHRFDMPSMVDGHSEWYHYGALGVAREFVRTHAELLRMSEGHCVNPSKVPPPRLDRRKAPTAGSTPFRGVPFQLPSRDIMAAHNDHVVTVIEDRVARLLSTRSLIGSRSVEDTLHLYFQLGAVSKDDLEFHPYNLIYNMADAPSGTVFRGTAWLFTSQYNEKFYRLSIAGHFYRKQSPDDEFNPRARQYGLLLTWEDVAPGIARIRAALQALVRSAPELPPEHPAAALNHLFRE